MTNTKIISVRLGVDGTKVKVDCPVKLHTGGSRDIKLQCLVPESIAPKDAPKTTTLCKVYRTTIDNRGNVLEVGQPENIPLSDKEPKKRIDGLTYHNFICDFPNDFVSVEGELNLTFNYFDVASDGVVSGAPLATGLLTLNVSGAGVTRSGVSLPSSDQTAARLNEIIAKFHDEAVKHFDFSENLSKTQPNIQSDSTKFLTPNIMLDGVTQTVPVSDNKFEKLSGSLYAQPKVLVSEITYSQTQFFSSIKNVYVREISGRDNGIDVEYDIIPSWLPINDNFWQTQITANTDSIKELSMREANRDHYKGVFKTIAQLIEKYPNASDKITPNDYAEVIETGTTWVYSSDGSLKWDDTELVYASDTTLLDYETLPSMNGEASPGKSAKASPDRKSVV